MSEETFSVENDGHALVDVILEVEQVGLHGVLVHLEYAGLGKVTPAEEVLFSHAGDLLVFLLRKGDNCFLCFLVKSIFHVPVEQLHVSCVHIVYYTYFDP